jgi:hypothetical protein
MAGLSCVWGGFLVNRMAISRDFLSTEWLFLHDPIALAMYAGTVIPVPTPRSDRYRSMQ